MDESEKAYNIYLDRNFTSSYSEVKRKSPKKAFIKAQDNILLINTKYPSFCDASNFVYRIYGYHQKRTSAQTKANSKQKIFEEEPDDSNMQEFDIKTIKRKIEHSKNLREVDGTLKEIKDKVRLEIKEEKVEAQKQYEENYEEYRKRYSPSYWTDEQLRKIITKIPCERCSGKKKFAPIIGLMEEKKKKKKEILREMDKSKQKAKKEQKSLI